MFHGIAEFNFQRETRTKIGDYWTKFSLTKSITIRINNGSPAQVPLGKVVFKGSCHGARWTPVGAYLPYSPNRLILFRVLLVSSDHDDLV